MSEEDLVLYETDGKVGIVTLNRPDKLMRSMCRSAWRRWRP